MSGTEGSVLAIQQIPSEAVELDDRGQRLLAEGKLEEARAAFDKAVLLAPNRARAYLDRAQVLDKLGFFSEAQSDRQTARALMAAQKSGRPAWTAAAAVRVEDEEDVVGPGRYVLNFILAGLPGLAVTYFLRHSGWLATWISLAILAVAVIILVAGSG
jgi:tetratricopeptide (TPR) repeat protein